MMKSSRIKVYAYFDKASNAFTVSGIEFREFIQYLTVPLDNLLLVKGDYFGNRVSNHFELLEGRESIAQLAREEIYTWGDFCFFDYSTNGNPDNLTKQEIAEILYFAHTREAMRPPFFAALHNRFAYYTHDDGWQCKIYCCAPEEFAVVLYAKLFGVRAAQENTSGVRSLLEQCEHGILCDLQTCGTAEVQIKTVGRYTDMDAVLNHSEMAY